ESGALLLINDRVDLALLCQADGVHLGPDDWPVEAVRRAVGPRWIIGASCGTAEEARAAESAGASYIGAGAVFGTLTKSDAGPPIGVEGLRTVVAATSLPTAGIGGVSARNITQVTGAGARM